MRRTGAARARAPAPANVRQQPGGFRRAPDIQLPANPARQGEEAHRAGTLGRDAGPPSLGPQAELVRQPGGEVVTKLLHPGFITFERIFETLPEDGMFSPEVSPGNPFQFTVGAYQVPEDMKLWLVDYHFTVLLQDGLMPGQYRIAEDGRFQGVLGFDLNVAGQREGDIAYQLDPVPIQVTQQQFEQPVTRRRTTSAQFVRAAAGSFAATSSQGSSLMPARRSVQGPDSRSWAWIIDAERTLAVQCVIFRRLRVPIAGVYARVAGHLLHSQLSDTLENRIRPR